MKREKKNYEREGANLYQCELDDVQFTGVIFVKHSPSENLFVTSMFPAHQVTGTH